MTSDDGTYCAAVAATQGECLNLINMVPHKADRHASIMRAPTRVFEIDTRTWTGTPGS